MWAHMGMCLEQARMKELTLALESCEKAEQLWKTHEKALPGSTEGSQRPLALTWLYFYTRAKTSLPEAAEASRQRTQAHLEDILKRHPEDKTLEEARSKLLKNQL